MGYDKIMKWTVVIKKKATKGIQNLPKGMKAKLVALIKDLENSGPYQPAWPNYSPLENDDYHCHLSYSWVACWRETKKGIEIEVYYVGSREKAPY
jgi:hypothetical protein|tara:strand:- start:22453 stop:22737 length:285 start_codon:yes stop_codon:yes gene_type:complete